MIAAIYARKSTDQSDRHEDAKSVARQIEGARDYAARRGWSAADAHVYEDDGVSGAEFGERRPGLQALLAAAGQPPCPFDGLIVSEQSRLGRETIRTLAVIQQIQEAGIRIFSYLDDREITLEDDADEVQEFIRSWSSSQERRKASQRTREALARQAKAGHVTGGRKFGYDNRVVCAADGKRHHVERVVNPAQARIVRRIFERYAEGAGFKRIAHELNAERAPAPRPRADRPAGWSPGTVRVVLDDPIYLGRVVWGRTRKRDARGRRITRRAEARRPQDDWLSVERPDLRIIPDELWQRVAERRRRAAATYGPGTGRGRPAGKPAAGTESPYLLTGFCACAVCSGSLGVRSRSHGRRRAYFYECLTHVQRGSAVCANALAAPMEAADAAVLDLVEDALLCPEVVAAALEEAAARLRPDSASQAGERRRLETELRQIEDQLGRFVQAIGQGGEIPELVAAVRERRAQRERLQHELAALDRLARIGQLDGARLRHDLAAKLRDWRGLLRRHVQQARQILSTLLDGRLRFTPHEDAQGRYYAFEGAGRLEPLLKGVVDSLPTGLVAPRGFEPFGNSPNPRNRQGCLTWATPHRLF
jgi:DNA invertase Pin-like site-specific DNA recombinase